MSKLSKILIISLVSLYLSTSIPASVHAFDPWTTTDKLLLTSSALAMGIDWMQSRKIAGNPDRWGERNPILSRHPSRNQVDIYFGAAMVLVPVVAHILPGDWRKGFLIGTTVLSVGCVVHNFGMGVGIEF